MITFIKGFCYDIIEEVNISVPQIYVWALQVEFTERYLMLNSRNFCQINILNLGDQEISDTLGGWKVIQLSEAFMSISTSGIFSSRSVSKYLLIIYLKGSFLYICREREMEQT